MVLFGVEVNKLVIFSNQRQVYDFVSKNFIMHKPESLLIVNKYREISSWENCEIYFYLNLRY